MERYDMIVIGSGPAGLSAGIYGVRAGLKLLVLEKYAFSGGQILNTDSVDNYLGLPGINGLDMGVKFREHADALGVPFLNAEVTGIELQDAEGLAAGTETGKADAETGKMDTVPGNTESGKAELAAAQKRRSVKVVHTDQGDFAADALILAMGAEHAHLGAPGEEEFSGKGVSYCATCDGALYRGKTVAVIGGGDVALEDAIYLARFCKKVYCIHRRDEFRGAKILQDRLLALENVEVLYSHITQAIEGTGKVERLVLEDKKTGEQKSLEVAGVFIAVGIKPVSSLVSDLVSCDASGYVLAGEDCQTSQEGIYVAGDLRKKPLRQIVTAVADGANAAVSAGNYLQQLVG